MSDYEAQRQRHVTGALALAPRLIEQMSWPAAGSPSTGRSVSANWRASRPSDRRGTASACLESTLTAWTRRPLPSCRC